MGRGDWELMGGDEGCVWVWILRECCCTGGARGDRCGFLNEVIGEGSNCQGGADWGSGYDEQARGFGGGLLFAGYAQAGP
jgi:hypothetical protein